MCESSCFWVEQGKCRAWLGAVRSREQELFSLTACPAACAGPCPMFQFLYILLAAPCACPSSLEPWNDRDHHTLCIFPLGGSYVLGFPLHPGGDSSAGCWVPSLEEELAAHPRPHGHSWQWGMAQHSTAKSFSTEKRVAGYLEPGSLNSAVGVHLPGGPTCRQGFKTWPWVVSDGLERWKWVLLHWSPCRCIHTGSRRL